MLWHRPARDGSVVYVLLFSLLSFRRFCMRRPQVFKKVKVFMSLPAVRGQKGTFSPTGVRGNMRESISCSLRRGSWDDRVLGY